MDVSIIGTAFNQFLVKVANCFACLKNCDRPMSGGLYECREMGDVQPDIVAFKAIAATQQLGGVAAFVDVENRFDEMKAVGCGVDVDELFVAQPQSGEETFAICDSLVKSGAVDVVVIDSIASMYSLLTAADDDISPEVTIRQELTELSRSLRKTRVKCIVIKPRTFSFPKGVKRERLAA